MDDMRKFSRVEFHHVVEVSSDTGDVIGQIRDIGAKGLYLLTSDRIDPGSQCKLKISLIKDVDQLTIHAQGVILRNEEHGMAIEFVSVDIESFPHLKQLILHNAENPEQVEREFNDHLGIKPIE